MQNPTLKTPILRCLLRRVATADDKAGGPLFKVIAAGARQHHAER